jgi:hypothetical protein
MRRAKIAPLAPVTPSTMDFFLEDGNDGMERIVGQRVRGSQGIAQSLLYFGPYRKVTYVLLIPL